jgi:AraC-like DNA-binding protein
MNYQRFQPSIAVARYIEFYWLLEGKFPANYVQRIVPDGRPVLILNFARPFETQTGRAWQSQPHCFFLGQITGPLLLRPSGPAGMLGIQFRPEGAARLLRFPMSELTDSTVPIDALSRKIFRKLEPACEFSSPKLALAALDVALCQLAKGADASSDPISHATREIERTAGQIAIRELARHIGWSPRQLQRRFKETVGISPKLFGRMRRFQRVLWATDCLSPDWVSAAVDCGYYDQAHLISDFREFSGKTPTALTDREIDLARCFLRREPVSLFSKTHVDRSR